ncbi:hypothetical protein E8E12_000052, partial [Didymella heteroderae]
MRQVSYPTETTYNAATRAIADAALADLTPPTDPPTPQVLSLENAVAPIASRPPDEAESTTAAPYEDVGPTGASGLRIRAKIETQPVPLPSLLQYVDHVLMHAKDKHDHPSHPAQTALATVD